MTQMTRREALATAGAVAVGSAARRERSQAQEKAVKKARLKQSVCRWCYQRIPLDEFCKGVAQIGLTAVDLLQPEEWEVAAKYGLICSTGYPGKGGGSIPDGLNNRMLHDTIVKTFESVAAEGQADGRAEPDHVLRQPPRDVRQRGDRQLRRRARTASQPMAESHGITVVVELLNSKVDHTDYQGDHTTFGVKVVQARRLAADQAAVRHLPHADHGRRHHPHHPAEQAVVRALSHRRRPGPARARPHAGAAVAGGRERRSSIPATPATSRTSSFRRAIR